MFEKLLLVAVIALSLSACATTYWPAVATSTSTAKDYELDLQYCHMIAKNNTEVMSSTVVGGILGVGIAASYGGNVGMFAVLGAAIGGVLRLIDEARSSRAMIDRCMIGMGYMLKPMRAVETPQSRISTQEQSQYLASNRAPTQKKALPPKLVFNASSPRVDGTTELSGQVTSSAGISEILINNHELEVPLAEDGSFKVTRFLPMGVTTYRLSVVDEFGQKADAEVNVAREAPQLVEEKVAPLNPRKIKAKSNPDAVALIIGVGDYSDLPKAEYAKQDANQFYDFANLALGVPTNKIKLLTDADASRIDLLQAMRNWMRTEVVSGKSDVYIFFAGHGLASPDGSKTYLLPSDGHRDLLDESSILRDDLIASAKGARTITMFLDTCYSGGTRGTEILLAGARPVVIVPVEGALPPNVTLLAAATGSQLSSTYDAAQHGLFSYWLMKGLEGEADVNRDKKITTGELHDYVSKRVGSIAQRRNRQQNPQLIGDRSRVLVSY